MQYGRIAIIALLALALTSCGAFSKIKIFDNREYKGVHPARPMPTSLIAPEWKVLTATTHDSLLSENSQYSYMCISWEDYLIMGQNMNNLGAFIKGQNALLCHYRKDLNEVECKPYAPTLSETEKEKD
jgi:hypothetical protein